MKLNSCAYIAKLICLEENTFAVPKRFNLFIQQDNSGRYVSNVREIPGCHIEGSTLRDLMDDTREAIQVYLGDENNRILSEFVEIRKIRV